MSKENTKEREGVERGGGQERERVTEQKGKRCEDRERWGEQERGGGGGSAGEGEQEKHRGKQKTQEQRDTVLKERSKEGRVTEGEEVSKEREPPNLSFLSASDSHSAFRGYKKLGDSDDDDEGYKDIS